MLVSNLKENIILFDQDTQHYRQSVYRFLKHEFEKIGYKLIVYYDKKLNDTIVDDELFQGIEYNLNNFINVVKYNSTRIVIQFVWLRYKFLFPFMFWAKLNGVKIIVWSHGINLQNKDQLIKNQFYYFRQRLADALIIYTPEQKKYIKANKKKIFVANNTINFNSLPSILESKEKLKIKYNLQGKTVILTVGRMNTNNRKVEHLIRLSNMINDNFIIIIIGPGVETSQIKNINNIRYLGEIYDQKIISEYFKLSDIFVMPGSIGLAINQAFYYGTPVIIEDVEQGPEAYYLKENLNGFYYRKGDVKDLFNKIEKILDKKMYSYFCQNAKKTIVNEASIEKMTSGFIKAINYVEKNVK